MGATIDSDGNVKFIVPADGKGIAGIALGACRYSTSWDWLMPVVDFIESMGFTVRVESSTDIIGPHYYGCWIWQDPEDNPAAATAHMDTRIEAVYVCVVEFIEWYNQQPHA